MARFPQDRRKKHFHQDEPQCTKKPCAASGKIKWLTEHDAQLVIEDSIRRRQAGTKCETRAYRCPDCDFWHTTHMKEYITRDRRPDPEPSAQPIDLRYEPEPTEDLRGLARAIARGLRFQGGDAQELAR